MRGWLGLLVAGLVLAVLVASSGATVVHEKPGPNSKPLPPVRAATSAPLPPLPVGATAEARKRERDARDRRATAAARERRQASRSAHRGLDRNEAVDLLKREYPDLLDKASGQPVLPPGFQKLRHVGTRGVAVETPNGKHAVIDSLQPLVTETQHGRAPVDLTLVDRGKAFEPATPLTPVLIPQRLSSGIELQKAGITITPVDASGKGLGAQGGAVDRGAVVFANTQTDTDMVVRPVALGVETNSVLRSVDSPQRLAFRVGMPDDAELVRDPTGALAIKRHGAVLAQVLPPVARDAAGDAVPVKMHASGDRITLAVEHRKGDWEYPIDVDPVIADQYPNNRWWWPWVFQSSGNVGGDRDYYILHDYYYIRGALLISGGNANAGDFGAWNYRTQGTSRIFSFDVYSKGEESAGMVQRFVGLTDNVGGYLQWAAAGGGGDWAPRVCGAGDCSPSGGAPGNVAIWRTTVFYNDSSFSTWLTNASVMIAQDTNIAVSFDGGQQEWLGPGGRIPATATDQGIGVSSVTFRSPDVPEWDERWHSSGGSCDSVQCWPTLRSSAFATDLPEGVHTVTATATNAVSTATATRQVKIDNTPPTISLTGALADADGTAVPGGKYPVHIVMRDGTATNPGAGVANLVVRVDGREAYTGHKTCAPGPCETSDDWVYDPARYSSGSHTITFEAQDNTLSPDTKQTKVIHITSYQGARTALGPGEVDLASGQLALTVADASLATPFGTLSVGRTFTSRESAGKPGPFGPSWRLALGAGSEASWQRLTELPNGDVQLFGASGSSAIAAKQDSGEFTPPPGYGIATVAKNADDYRVTDIEGNVTTLRQVAGSTGFLTTAIQAPGKPGPTLYSYEAAPGGVRPTKILGVSPAGVDCSGGLIAGCRALSLVYAESTTAAGDGPSQWGDFADRLKQIEATAFDPATSAMRTMAVARYAYDGRGRLRAAWDPRVSPPLKTTYGYDGDDRVTALTPPGEKSWIIDYGTASGDPGLGRVLDVRRRDAGTGDGGDVAPANTQAPQLSSSHATVARRMSVSIGSWSNDPVSYSYQWMRCEAGGAGCVVLPGATRQTYTPKMKDYGHALVARVTATNGGGSTTVDTTHVAVDASATPVYDARWGNTPDLSFYNPAGAAVDADGNVWVADAGDYNNTIRKFDPHGNLLQTANIGIFHPLSPRNIAINRDTGAIYVTSGCADWYGNCQAQLSILNANGERQNEFNISWSTLNYSWGRGTPYGIAVAPDGNLWFADTAGQRVVELTPDGYEQREFPVNDPTAITISDGKLFVSSESDMMVEVFTFDGELVAHYDGTSSPGGLAADPRTGNVYLVDLDYDRYWKPPRIHKLSPDAQLIEKFAPDDPDVLRSPVAVATAPSGEMYTVDAGWGGWDGAVERWLPRSLDDPGPGPDPTRPEMSHTATWTVDYNVPWERGHDGVDVLAPEIRAAGWGQKERPSTTTAIFPPNAVPADNGPSSYDPATVYYLDRAGNNTNTASPGGRISTTEYDEERRPTRILSAANLTRVINAGSQEWQAKAHLLDTQYTYSAAGDLLRVLEPQHKVALDNGSEVDARKETRFTYDEGAPAGGPYHLVTTAATGALVSGQTSATDVRVSRTAYDGQDGLGWTLKKPTSVTTDPGGLALVRTTLYDAGTGAVTETRQPGNPSGGDAHATKTVYYTAGDNAADAACGNHPEWAGLACKTGPGAQPASTELPDVPTTRTEYTVWGQPTKVTQTTSVPDTAPTMTASALKADGKATTTDPEADAETPTRTTGSDAAGDAEGESTADDAGGDGGADVPTTTTDSADDSGDSATTTAAANTRAASEGDTTTTTPAEGDAGTTTPDAGADPQAGDEAPTPESGSQPDEGADPTSALQSDVRMQTASPGAHTRTTTVTYDDAGRLTATHVTATSGADVPTATYRYDEATGMLDRQATSGGDTAQTISRSYDSRGRIVGYTDADGNTSSYTYDLAGRLTSIDDGKGVQTLSYDPITGDLVAQDDSVLGRFTAEYDADGNVTQQTYPTGVEAKSTFDETGTRVGVTYTKTSNCSSGCRWFEDAVTPSIHDEWRKRTNTRGATDYHYDAAGRLTLVQETPAGGECSTRRYVYDADSNRTSATTIPAGAGGGCNVNPADGATKTFSYDAADRLLGAAAGYDPWGNITALPAAQAGGAPLTATYYADGAARELSQADTTVTTALDPAGRARSEHTSAGETEATVVSHFSEDGDSPSWTADASGHWTRYVTGITGALTATHGNDQASLLQLTDLHGDVIATAPADGAASGPTWTTRTDEFGTPAGNQTTSHYGWLGAHGRETLLPGGVIGMGARTYAPTLGRFLQPDPVAGGSASAYDYANADPVNGLDLAGLSSIEMPDWLYALNARWYQDVIVWVYAVEMARRAAAAAAAAASAAPVPAPSEGPSDGPVSDESHASARNGAFDSLWWVNGLPWIRQRNTFMADARTATNACIEGLILGELSVRTYEKLAKTAVKTNPDVAFVGCLADAGWAVLKSKIHH